MSMIKMSLVLDFVFASSIALDFSQELALLQCPHQAVAQVLVQRLDYSRQGLYNRLAHLFLVRALKHSNRVLKKKTHRPLVVKMRPMTTVPNNAKKKKQARNTYDDVLLELLSQ